jgi:hypothetical protein
MNKNNITRDDILNMPAGRELNILIAENVMGWKHSRVIPNSDIITGGDLILWTKPDNVIITIYDLPDYSNDIASAWLVLEHMGNTYGWKPHNGVMIMRENDNWYVELPQPNWECAEAASPALAICRATLLAVIG